MAAEATQQQYSLQVKRRFAAPREKVFRAWTDPEAVKQWHASDEYQTHVAELDLRVGGRYRFEFKRLSDGVVKPVWGTYREVRAPERLVYTWQMDSPDIKLGETVVTVEFLDRGGETEVVLTHELYPNAEICEQHNQGWNACFDRLPKCLD